MPEKVTGFLDEAHKRDDLPEFDPTAPCPTCGGTTQVGFGMAGGGYGAYTFCERCEFVTSKSEEEA